MVDVQDIERDPEGNKAVDSKLVDELEKSNKLLIEIFNCKPEDQKKYDGYSDAIRFLFQDIITRVPDNEWCIKLGLKFGNRLGMERNSVVLNKLVGWFTIERTEGELGGRIWKGDLEYVYDPMENRQQYYYFRGGACECFECLIKLGWKKGWGGEPTEKELEQMMSPEFRKFADIPDYCLGDNKTIVNHIVRKARLCSFYKFDSMMLDVVFERVFFSRDNFEGETKLNLDRYACANDLLEIVYKNKKELGITEKLTQDDVNWLRLWDNNTDSQKRILLCKVLELSNDKDERLRIKSLFTIDEPVPEQKESNSTTSIYERIQERVLAEQQKEKVTVAEDSFELMLETLIQEISSIREEILILSRNMNQKKKVLENKLKQKDCLETLLELKKEEN